MINIQTEAYKTRIKKNKLLIRDEKQQGIIAHSDSFASCVYYQFGQLSIMAYLQNWQEICIGKV